MAVIIDSAGRVELVSGAGITINAPVVPNFTSDDIFMATNPSQTLTQALDNKQTLIGTITANANDLNTLAGAAAAGLVAADLTKLADLTVTAAELNRTSGLTSNAQTQITALSTGKATGAGVDLTGLTVSAAQLNSFFATAITTSAAEINLIDGLTATAADLNALAGTAGQVIPADLIKLGDITATASQINALNGFSGSSTDLNKLVGMTATTSDLNKIAGLAAYAVTATELQYLAGLSTNVQTFISNSPSLSGLTASASDLNLLAGAAAGTGNFAGASVSATEISYLDGVTSNLQAQLNAKSATGHTHGISEITGSSITTVELNYLQGASSNIQSQLNSVGSGKLSLTGGNMTGPLGIANGSSANPSLQLVNSPTTGFYRAGADQIGIAIAAAAFGSVSASVVQFGIGTTGAPSLRAASPTAADPAYSFISDPDTGMYRAGANSLGFSANAANYMTIDAGANLITIGAAAATNSKIRMSGFYEGFKLIGSVTSIDCTGIANFPIYTIPTGRKLIVTMIYIVAENISGAGTAPKVNFGVTGANFDEIVDGSNNNCFSSPVAINTTGQVLVLGVGDNTFPAISGSSGADYQFLTAGQAFTARVATATTGYAAYTVSAHVFGYEFA